MLLSIILRTRPFIFYHLSVPLICCTFSMSSLVQYSIGFKLIRMQYFCQFSYFTKCQNASISTIIQQIKINLNLEYQELQAKCSSSAAPQYSPYTVFTSFPHGKMNIQVEYTEKKSNQNQSCNHFNLIITWSKFIRSLLSVSDLPCQRDLVHLGFLFPVIRTCASFLLPTSKM